MTTRFAASTAEPAILEIAGSGSGAGIVRHSRGLGAFGETAITNVAVLAISVVSSSLAARILGPSGRGELAAIQLWPSYLISFGSLGLMTSTSYHCGKFPEQARRIFGTAWAALLALSLPLMVFGYWLMPKVLANEPSAVVASARIFLLFIPIQLAGNLPYHVLQGLGRFFLWNAIRIQFTFLWIGVLICAAMTSDATASFIAYGYLIAMGLHCLTWNWALMRAVPGPYVPDFRRLPEMLRYGLPSMLSTVPQQLNLRLDQLLMAAFMAPRTLGLYVVAVAWSGTVAPVLVTIAQVAFPRLAGQRQRAAQIEMASRTLRLSTVTAGATVLMVLAATPVLLPVMFGQAFRPALSATLVLVVAGGAAGLNVVAGQVARGLGLPRDPLIAESVGLLCTAILLALLLPRYQLMGAAIASLVSYLATYATYIVLLCRHIDVGPRKVLVPAATDVRYVMARLRTAV